MQTLAVQKKSQSDVLHETELQQSSLNTRIEQLSQELDELKTFSKDQTTEISSLSTEKTSLQDKLTDVEKTLCELNNIVQLDEFSSYGVCQRAEELRKEHSDYKWKTQTLERKVIELSKELQDQSESREFIDMENLSLKQEINDLKSECSGLKYQVEQLLSSKADPRSSPLGLETIDEEEGEDDETAMKRLSQITADVTVFKQEKMLSSPSHREEYERKLAIIKPELGSEREVQRLTGLGSGESEVFTLKTIIKQLEQEKDQMLSVLSDKTREVSTLKTENQSLRNAVQSADSQTITELKNQLQQVSTALTNKHQENVAYHAEIQRLQDVLQHYDKKQKTANESLTQISTLKKKVTELENQLRSSQQSEIVRHQYKSVPSQLASLLNLTQNTRSSPDKFEIAWNEVSRMLNSTELSKDLGENEKKVWSDVKSVLTQLQNSIRETYSVLQKSKMDLSHAQETVIQAKHEAGNERENGAKLQAEVGRLRQHLVGIEENYTQEIIQLGQSNAELFNRVHELESHSNNVQSGSSELQRQLKQATIERDELRRQIEEKQGQITELTTSTQNLQNVLDHFQLEQGSAVKEVESRTHSQVLVEQQQREKLQHQVTQLTAKLSKAEEGLNAAARVSQQLDKKEETIKSLRLQLENKEADIVKLKNENTEISQVTQGKVDRAVVKSLVVGYFSTARNQQHEVLRIIADVLDFNEEERKKSGLIPGGWMPGWWSKSSTQSSNKSLLEEFVRFLEQESRPTLVPTLHSQSTSSDTKTQVNPFLSTQRSTTPNSLLFAPIPTFVNEQRSESVPLTSRRSQSPSTILSNVLDS